ncbi:hypothetical protein ScPMuIL_001875 [Solemya velum]
MEADRPWGLTDEAHPELFDLRAKPTQPVTKPGQLSEEDLRKYFEDGYVVVKDVFTNEQLDACKDAINHKVEQLAHTLFDAGKIKNLYSDHGFNDRLTLIEQEFPGANILLHKKGAIPEAFRRLWTSEKLLNIAEQLIGPDIMGHPVWNLRTKTPNSEATTVPLHQDVAYLDTDSYKVHQPTAWAPLLDSTEQNGCLEVAHRGHKTGKVGEHLGCYGNTWYVWLEEKEMEKTLEINPKTDFVVCPVPYGGILLFNNMVPHRSLPNKSDKIRWSIDMRFQRPDLPVGFYGLKQGILFRSPSKPNHVINWDEFEAVDRKQIQQSTVTEGKTKDEFDTTVQGPWMTKWRIVHVNRHVEKLRAEGTSWHSS